MAQPVRQPETLLRIVVTETDKGEPLAYAVCSLISEQGQTHTATAGDEGMCVFRNLPRGVYRLQVFYMGQTFRQPARGGWP